MTLTEFGKVVRKARIDVNETLLTMAKTLDTSPAFLSGMETGRKKIPAEWVQKITNFFSQRGLELKDLDVKAHVANESVPINGLEHEHQCLVAGFAKSNLTREQLQQFADLLNKHKKR